MAYCREKLSAGEGRNAAKARFRNIFRNRGLDGLGAVGVASEGVLVGRRGSACGCGRELGKVLWVTKTMPKRGFEIFFERGGGANAAFEIFFETAF